MVLNLFKKKSEYALKLERILGFYPDKISLYQQAFTHKSTLVDEAKKSFESNERLEFLGDAILDAVISSYIYGKFPFKDEGFLTKLRSKLVRRQFLNRLAEKIGLEELIVSSLDRESKSILGDALEALIGAIYLDKGYGKAEDFILSKLIQNHVELNDVIETETDFKSRAIEWAQKNKKTYEFQIEEIDSEFSKTYLAKLFMDNELKGKGEALSKKKAEQLASEQFFKEKDE